MTLSKLFLISGLAAVDAATTTSTTTAAASATTTAANSTGNTTATPPAGNTTAAATTAAATTASATTMAATTAASNATTAAGSVQVTRVSGIKNTATIACAASVCGANSTRRNLQTTAQASACDNYVSLVLGNANAKTAYCTKMMAAEPLLSNAAACTVAAVTRTGCSVTGGNLNVVASYSLDITPKSGTTNTALQAAITSGNAALQTAAAAAGKEAVKQGIANMSAADKTTFATSIGKTAADITTAFADSVANSVTADASGVTMATVTVTTAAPAASSSVSAAFGIVAAMFSAALLF